MNFLFLFFLLDVWFTGAAVKLSQVFAASATVLVRAWVFPFYYNLVLFAAVFFLGSLCPKTCCLVSCWNFFFWICFVHAVVVFLGQTWMTSLVGLEVNLFDKVLIFGFCLFVTTQWRL